MPPTEFEAQLEIENKEADARQLDPDVRSKGGSGVGCHPPALIGTDESLAGYYSAGLVSTGARPPLHRPRSESDRVIRPAE